MKNLVGKIAIKRLLDSKCIYVEQISLFGIQELNNYLSGKVEVVIEQAVKYLKSHDNAERLSVGHIRQAIKDIDAPMNANDAQKGYLDIKKDFVKVKDELRINEQRVETLRQQNEVLEKRLKKYEKVNVDANDY